MAFVLSNKYFEVIIQSLKSKISNKSQVSTKCCYVGSLFSEEYKTIMRLEALYVIADVGLN